MKYVITLFTLTAILTSSTSVFAQNIQVTTTGRGETTITPLPTPKPILFLEKENRDIRESSQDVRRDSLKEIKDIREGAKEEMREIKAEGKLSVEEERNHIRKSHGFVILKQIILAEIKLNQTIKGIESRIAKMNEQGKDTTEAIPHIEKAKAHMQVYAEQIVALKASLADTTAEGEFTTTVKDIRLSLMSVQQELKTALSLLKKAGQ